MTRHGNLESPFETNSCFNIVLEIENNVTLTNVNLKLKVESIGIHSVIVILLFDKTRPKIENFVHFDSFSSKEQFSSYIEKYAFNYFVNFKFKYMILFNF